MNPPPVAVKPHFFARKDSVELVVADDPRLAGIAVDVVEREQQFEVRDGLLLLDGFEETIEPGAQQKLAGGFRGRAAGAADQQIRSRAVEFGAKFNF